MKVNCKTPMKKLIPSKDVKLRLSPKKLESNVVIATPKEGAITAIIK